MYKPVQKKSSSWTPASSQSKSKSLTKPRTFSVQPKPESKSSEQQEMPSYSTIAADALAANVMRSLETQAQSVEQGKDLDDEMSVGAGTIQRKLTVGAPGDQYEQEADHVAAQVMSMSVAPDSSPQVQRFGEEDNPVQRWSLAQSITPVVQRQVDEQVQMRELVQRAFQSGGTEASGDLESRLNASKGGGSALAPEVRSFMEPRFGADFSSVRVHTGSEAVQMNRELGAQAFAHGSDVYFGAGKEPGNNELTAHELTHVVQQTGVVQRQLNGNIQKAPTIHPTLRQGSRGSSVEELQQKVNAQGAAPPLAVDGIFGPLTRAAVVHFQQSHQDSTGTALAPDGIVGQLTWGALDHPAPTPTPPTPTPPTLTIASQTVNAAPNGAPNTRTQIGVGEQVRFTGSASGTWSMSGGKAVGATSGTTFLWKAPAVGGSVSITLTNGSNTATSTMNVVAPTSLSMTKVSEDSYPSGWAGAGMITDVTINPLNVCLGATQWLEVPGPATNVTGYFTQFSAANLYHNPNPNYLPFNDNNTGLQDHAAISPGVQLPTPFSAGTWQWDIPNKYKLDGESDSSGRLFTTTTQLYTMHDATGAMTVTKAGASVSRTP